MRPDPRLVALVRDDWADLEYMTPSAVPADWRTKRLAVQARVMQPTLFLDVEDPRTHRLLEPAMAGLLIRVGQPDLDIAAVRGGDRRLTRWISHWAWSQVDPSGRPRYAGIRYLSRLNSEWECWAVFDHVRLHEIQRRPILRSMPELRATATHFGLVVH